jgi:UDP-N-acetyl-D-galactosamine dehydrogenase
LEAAGTKWNFLPFKPGLVGGHCIGVDPYYLTHKAESLGYHAEVILAGRRINDNMGLFVANKVIKLLLKKGHNLPDSKVLILGITFKENCPDIRNSRVIDIIEELKNYNTKIDVYDPWASAEEVKHEYHIDLILEVSQQYDAVILAVSHSKFKDFDIKKLLKPNTVVYDIKSFLDTDLIDARL